MRCAPHIADRYVGERVTAVVIATINGDWFKAVQDFLDSFGVVGDQRTACFSHARAVAGRLGAADD